MNGGIQGKLARLQDEAAEREARRQEEQLEFLMKKLSDLALVRAEIDNFDWQNQSVALFLDLILGGALANRVSDIHLEPEVAAVKIRYRIDGLLYDVTGFSPQHYKPLLSRLKLLSKLKINITDRPQDGRFTLKLPAKEVEFRVSLVPSEYGETAVLRVLDPEMINLALEDLGLRPDDLAIVEEELPAPNGLILNTGPTGSGKTTTLYAFLKKRQTSELKIITIEDPIEYRLAGIEQTQVIPGGEYNFANGLRSIMRQDPDIILVGEIRDRETAEIALQAALTGHLVFSTVHANQASGAIPRLLDLGVRTKSIGPALNLIMAQRLLRRLCQYCKKAVPLSPEAQGQWEKFLSTLPSRVERDKLQTAAVFEPVGCPRCNQIGYQGRIGIFELLLVDEALEDFIEKQASETEVQQFALNRGMVTMQQDGLIKALQGITSLAEVEAVTGKLLF